MNLSVLFHVTNKHSASSGTPPSFDGSTPNRYHSYFENGYGEQLIFVYDHEADTGTLYHGDLGWEHPRPVEEGGKSPSIVLDQAEMLWLRACWLAATEGKRARAMTSPGDSDEQ